MYNIYFEGHVDYCSIFGNIVLSIITFKMLHSCPLIPYTNMSVKWCIGM